MVVIYFLFFSLMVAVTTAVDIVVDLEENPRGAAMYWNVDNDHILILGKDNSNTDEIAFLYTRDGPSLFTWSKLQEFPVYEGFNAIIDEWSSKAGVSGDLMAISDHRWPYPSGDYKGRVNVYKFNGTHYDLIQELRPEVEINTNLFGYYMDMDGDWMAVAGGIDGPSDDGRLYMFKFNGTQYEQTQFFEYYDNTAREIYHIRLDGNHMAVTSEEENSNKGSVKYYEYNGTHWEELAKVLPTDTASGDKYGSALAIKGSTVVVGARDQDSSTGAVYIYHYNGTDLELQTKLVGLDGQNVDFGQHLTITEDGQTVLVGSPNTDRDGYAITDEGAVYTYVNNSGTWEYDKYIWHQGSEISNSTRFTLDGIFYKDSEDLLAGLYLDDLDLKEQALGSTDSPTTSPTTSPTESPTANPTASPTPPTPEPTTGTPTISPTAAPTHCACVNDGWCNPGTNYCHCCYPYYGANCELVITCNITCN